MSLYINDANFVNFFDELPLWSAPFGEVILNAVRLSPTANVLDIGSGTGFPFIELAQRFGPDSKVYGLDPWSAALAKSKARIDYLGLTNAFPTLGVAESLPFEDDFFDVVVSNNGLNNVEDFEKAISEIYRVSKADGQFTFTYNLPETMETFYEALKTAMLQCGIVDAEERIAKHVNAKRKPVNETADFIRKSGFDIFQIYPSFFNMRFANAKALFNHGFIKSAFMPAWLEISSPEALEIAGKILDEASKKEEEIVLTVPFACFDCSKKSNIVKE